MCQPALYRGRASSQVCCWETGSLCSPLWPGTRCIGPGCPQNLPAFTTHELGLEVCNFVLCTAFGLQANTWDTAPNWISISLQRTSIVPNPLSRGLPTTGPNTLRPIFLDSPAQLQVVTFCLLLKNKNSEANKGGESVGGETGTGWVWAHFSPFLLLTLQGPAAVRHLGVGSLHGHGIAELGTVLE